MQSFHCTTVKIGNWLLKASSLDDQILICGYNTVTVESFMRLFYNEEVAYNFVESLNDKDLKTCNR
jgi:hypothetical protein